MNDTLKPNINILIKLASIAVHVEELFSPNGNAEFDKPAIETLLADTELQKWLKEMDKMALVPKKR